MKIKKYIHLKNNLKPILNVYVPWNKSILLTVSFTTTYYCFTICFLIFFCSAALWVITTSTSIVNELASSCWLFLAMVMIESNHAIWYISYNGCSPLKQPSACHKIDIPFFFQGTMFYFEKPNLTFLFIGDLANNYSISILKCFFLIC